MIGYQFIPPELPTKYAQGFSPLQSEYQQLFYFSFWTSDLGLKQWGLEKKKKNS